MKNRMNIGTLGVAALLLAAIIAVGCQPAGSPATTPAEGLSDTSLTEDVRDLQDLDQLSDELEDTSFEELDNLGLE